MRPVLVPLAVLVLRDVEPVAVVVTVPLALAEPAGPVVPHLGRGPELERVLRLGSVLVLTLERALGQALGVG
ncbi:hypothetical protein V1J52_04985 [Streptomyces sp. TRM 70351]|uniref:hypothetical protein n=1 Tax=Streptomyces sp. TRM 70351 TaxID=3116552 RepID=UPI002E7B220C|nr:hypothetical protein [Streptomyces sp. TRM 70351]MEE1927548.1 hypothetical protein [Streptomyces sp. TRM 70351]